MRFIFVLFLLVSQISFSQTQEIRGYITQNPDLESRLFNSQTGKLMTGEEIKQLKAEIPNFRYEPVYDLEGKVEKYLFDPADPQKVIRRNPELQPKVGELFPEFVVHTVKEEKITSSSLRGKWTLLYFQTSLSSLHREQFDQLTKDLKKAQEKTDLTAVAIFAYDESIEALVENQPIEGVKKGNGFFQKFHLISMPTVFLINPEGKIEGKFEGKKPIRFLDLIRD